MSESFRSHLLHHGYATSEPFAFDGRIRRLNWRGPSGKRPAKTGWYVGFDHGNFQAASWGDWRDGITESWFSTPERRLSAVEKQEIKNRVIEARSIAEHYRRRDQIRTGDRAEFIWERSMLVEECEQLPDYCQRKQIHGHRLRVWKDGAVIAALYDEFHCLVNLQIITKDGTKRFLKAGAVQGCHWVVGPLPKEEFEGDIIVTEGIATAGTIYRITGGTVFAAMNSGNLEHVVKWARAQWPKSRLLIAADDDRWKPDGTPRAEVDNAGRVKALAACQNTGALAIFPNFANPSSRGTDWNDLYCEESEAAARSKWTNAIAIAMLDRRITGLSTPQYQVQRPQLIAAYRAAGLATAGPQSVDARRRELRQEDPSVDEDEETPPAILVRIAEEAEFWHDQFGNAYVTYESEGSKRHGRVEGQAFADWLRMQYEDETGSAIPVGKQVIESVIAQFASRARARCDKFTSHIRCGAIDPSVHWLDLGRKDWSAVRIDKNGWTVTTSPAVKFIRPDDDGALPIPTPGSTRGLEPLWNIVNVAPEDRCLVAGWLLNALLSTAPVFGLNLYGSHGSAKSSASRFLRRMIDPSSALTQSLSEKRLDELTITCRDQWIPVFENVSYLSADMQDALCRLNTGETDRRRTLYTDFGMTKTFVRRPWIVNGINNVCTRGDLAERSVPVQLHPIPKDSRKTEEKINAEFEAIQPQLLAVLLDAASESLYNQESARAYMQSKGLNHRMADAALWITGGELAMGFPTGSFVTRLTEIQTEEGALALDGDPVVTTITALLNEYSSGVWQGTMKDLLAKVLENVGRSKNAPDDVRSLGRWLTRESPRLRDSLGIVVDDLFQKVNPETGAREWIRKIYYKNFVPQIPEI